MVEKIEGIGENFRGAFLPVTIIWYWLWIYLMMQALLSAASLPWWLLVFGGVYCFINIVSAVIYLWGMFRLSGYLTDDEVVIRSWFSTVRIPKSEVVSVESGYYKGLWGWLIPSYGGLSSIAGKEVFCLRFVTQSGKIQVNATVSRTRNHLGQLKQVTEWLSQEYQRFSGDRVELHHKDYDDI